MSHILQGTWDEIKTREQELAGHRLLVIVDPAYAPNAGCGQDHLEDQNRCPDFDMAPECCEIRRAKLLDALSW